MKKAIIILLCLVLCLGLFGCSKENPENNTEATPQQPLPDLIETIDLGCCVKEIEVRAQALLGANNVTHEYNDFIMTLSSDKQVYSPTDVIKIWATLEYVGDNDTIEIWYGCPFMNFSVVGGIYELYGMTIDILTSSILKKNHVYHFDYQKSGSWGADEPDAKFWENFFSIKDLSLPAGEYAITLHGGFSISESVLGSESGLKCGLIITVK